MPAPVSGGRRPTSSPRKTRLGPLMTGPARGGVCFSGVPTPVPDVPSWLPCRSVILQAARVGADSDGRDPRCVPRFIRPNADPQIDTDKPNNTAPFEYPDRKRSHDGMCLGFLPSSVTTRVALVQQHNDENRCFCFFALIRDKAQLAHGILINCGNKFHFCHIMKL